MDGGKGGGKSLIDLEERMAAAAPAARRRETMASLVVCGLILRKSGELYCNW